MFHWICPECGREIAPTATECPACEASSTVPAAELPASPAPEAAPCSDPSAAAQLTIVSSPAMAALRAPRTSAEPLEPQPEAVRFPAASAVAPAAPPVGLAIPCATVRKAERRAIQEAPPATAWLADHLSRSIPTQLPNLDSDITRVPALPFPGQVPNGVLTKVLARSGPLKPAGSEPTPQIGMPGPALAHELTSLSAAGVAKMLWFTSAVPRPSRKSGMFVSVAVASGFLALAIAGVFYAMPTMARSAAPGPETPRPAPAEVPAAPIHEPAAKPNPNPPELEVSGVRFVTDIPDRQPQIHYIVVNHTNDSLSGLVVTVTLRSNTDQAPLSQFSFRAPRLGPYESKEMVSTIERLNRPVDLPDWRDVQTEVQLSR